MWYAAREAWEMALLEAVGCTWEIGRAIVAVAIDNRDRTRSSGYVVPVVAVRVGTAMNWKALRTNGGNPSQCTAH